MLKYMHGFKNKVTVRRKQENKTKTNKKKSKGKWL